MTEPSEQREQMYAYTAESATFLGTRHQPCRFRTALCPDACGHATNMYQFRLDALTVVKNDASVQAKWVTPVTQGDEISATEQDMKGSGCLARAKALESGAKVRLEWTHDYVTVGGSSGPDRPVIALEPL